MIKIKLSIITPVYNNVIYIEKCIQNVIDQNVEGIEHVIMDGSSTDGTVDVIQRYANEYNHIRFVSESDRGQSDAMNKGIAIAQGEFITFLNVDDFFSDKTLSEVIQLIDSDSKIDFWVGACNVLLPDQSLQYINRPSKLRPWHFLSGYFLPVNPSAYFYRKSLHELVGGYNENNHHNMDIEFLVRVSFVAKMQYISSIWGNFRLLPGTKTVADDEAGLLTQRKKNLYNKILSESSFLIRIRTKLIILQQRLKRWYFNLRKKLFLPFDMVYFKLKKEMFRGK